MTTRIRFAFWSALASTIAVLVAGLVAIGSVESTWRNLVDSPLERNVAALVDATSLTAACEVATRDARDAERVVSVLAATREVCRSNPAAVSPRALGITFDDARAGMTSTRSAGGERWRVHAASRDDGSVVIVASIVGASERATRDATRSIVLAMTAGALIAAIIGAIASGPATRRIERLVERIRAAIADPDGERRVGVVGSRDLDAAARSVDLLLDELRAADLAQRRLFADAAHELRTPVTSIRTNAQLLERDASLGDEARDIAARIARQSAAVGTLVAGLVDHAAIGAWSKRDAGEVVLGELVREAIDRVHARVPDARITLDADDSLVRVDAELVRRAIGNLLDNALVHGAEPIDVLVRGGIVRVTDAGRGLDPAQVEDVFRPFSRGASSGIDGSGLGLAFVDHVARAHGGAARVVSTHPAVFELALPTIDPHG